MYVKVYGERNSGNCFLRELIHKNTDLELLDGHTESDTGWGHGYPETELLPENTLCICLVRTIKNWLSSMYNSPYHIYRHEQYDDFINKPVTYIENMEIADDPRETQTLCQIRYGKYNAYKAIRAPVIIVQMEWLQHNKARFLDLLRDKFNAKVNDKINYITRHIKTGKRGKRSYPRYSQLPTDVDNVVESEINNLEYILKK